MNVDHLLKQSCTVSTAGAQDKFGKVAEGAATTYPCRFQKTTRVIATPEREKTPIDGVVWLSASAVVGVGDKLIFGSQSYRVMLVQPMIDGKGATRHNEVMVQDWILK